MKKGLYRRILAGVGSNAFGHIITIFIQLCSLPVFLHFWTLGQYGKWLMLSAVPSYLSMADVGIVTSARNLMTMAMAAGDTNKANRIFQSALLFVSSAIMFVSLTGYILIFVFPVGQNLLVSEEIKIALWLLINGVVLAFFSGLFGAVFRSNGRYAFSNFSGHLLRFAEWLGGMLGLWLHADFIGVASGMLLTRILGSVALSVYAAYAVPDIQWRFKQVNWTDFKSMLSPSLYFMVFPLSSALSLQGFTLLVGALLGSADVAVFNTYRTIARLIVQVNSTLSFAVEPEMSRYFGASKMAELRNLFRKANLISSGMAVLASTLMFFVAQYFLEFWTHGRISYQPPLMMVMLAYATITGLWHIPKALLIAINQHRRMAIFSLLISGLSLLIAYSFAKYGYLLEPLLKEAGLSNEFLSRSYLLVEVTAILVFGEMAMAIIVHLQARKVLKHA